MNIYQIFGVIMGFLMIALCVSFARTNKSGYNNLFTMLMIGCCGIALTTLIFIYPTWWMVAIMSYALFTTWFYVQANYNKMEEDRSRDFAKGKKQKSMRKYSATWGMIILLAISITMLVRFWSWYIGLVFIPICAITALVTLVWIHHSLNKIWL